MTGGAGRGQPLVPLLLALLVGLWAGSCGEDPVPARTESAERGRELFVAHGCAACHQLSGVREAVGRVGPRLDDLHEQRIIAGVLPNTPGHLAAWIQNPSAHAPNTGMPDLGLTREEAVDIATFLLEYE